LPKAVFETLSPTPRVAVWLFPNHGIKITVLLPDKLLSEHVMETVKTIDQSKVCEHGLFLEFQKTVKMPNYIYVGHHVIIILVIILTFFICNNFVVYYFSHPRGQS